MIVAGGLLLYEGYKLLVQPLLHGAQGGLEEVSRETAKTIANRFVDLARKRLGVAVVESVAEDREAHPRAASDSAGPGPANDESELLEAAVSETIEHRGDADRLLAILGGGARTGIALGEAPESDAWFVSAYAAVLWRVANMAGWAGRPIAVAGALQGPDWTTVCVPRSPLNAGQVIDPASIWTTTAAGVRRRQHTSADFFVRIARAAPAESAPEGLNQEFIRSRRFTPGPATPDEEAWHRVDGISRGWVLLQWDDALQNHILKNRSYFMAHPRQLELNPPDWNELTEQWQSIAKICNSSEAITAMRSGADAYATAAGSSKAAAKAALGFA